ncbi:MAG: ArsR/SmtB family transcription factor [Nanoarchaeota archaeon]
MNCEPYDHFFTNLANRVNIQIILLLKNGPLNVKSITEKTGREQSAISHNLRRMHDCNIVTVEQRGRERYYSLNYEFILPILDLVDNHAQENCRNCSAYIKREELKQRA